jgi:hypothetical protein
MSCALPEKTLVLPLPRDGAGIAVPAALLAQLADGLHAMAQPLTILRGAIGAMQLAERGASEDRRYVDMSADQIGRLCDLLANLRSLLDVAQSEAVCSPQDWHDLVGGVLEGYEGDLPTSGVRMVVTHLNDSMRVLADAARTEQAMRAALDMAQALASHGDEIRCRVLPDGLELRNEHGRGKGLNSSERLVLSLVEAAICSQQGTCRFIEDPFCLSVTLPRQGSNITSDCLEAVV